MPSFREAFIAHYCGGNYSGHNVLPVDNFLEDSCVVSAVQLLPHVLFTIISALVLIVSCRSNQRRNNFLIRLPGHSIRWITFVALILTLVFQVEEGLLSDLIANKDVPTQPFLYIPCLFAILSGLSAIIYYHHLECWGKQSMCLLLVLYWAGSLACETFVMMTLYSMQHMSIYVIRWDLTIIKMFLYSVLLLLEVNVFRHWVVQNCNTFHRPLPDDVRKEDMRFFQGYTNLLSSALFVWLRWLFKLGYRRTLEPEDLGSLSVVHTTEYQKMRFERILGEQTKWEEGKKRVSLLQVFLKVYGRQMSAAGLSMLISVFTSFVIPLVLARTINSVGENQLSPSEQPTVYIQAEDFFSNGFVLVVILFLFQYTQLLSRQIHIHIANIESAHVKTAIQAAVYNKALHLSTWTISGGQMTTGQITNHMSLDATNILNCFQWIHYIWAIPFQLIGFLVILYFQLGFAPIISCLFFFLSIPFETLIARFVVKYQKKKMEYSDSRLKQTNEMLQGMKLIKLYGWEDVFEGIVSDLRMKEIGMLMKAMPWRMILYGLTIVTPAVTMLLTFVLYTLLSGKRLTPDVTFVGLSIFNAMYPPFILLPRVVTFLTNAYVSMKRLETYFSAQETEEQAPSDGFDNPDVGEDVVCKIDNGEFVWDKESPTPILSDVNLNIPSGKLTIIVGPVGSGKSSLISAVLGEMTTKAGTVHWNSEVDQIAFAHQKAWLLNASLKDNILFGNEYDRVRYQEVIKACSLQPDIDILPAGDLTEIGEKGINLSGGQKQRVSVARAMYSTHPVVILDDPLSALDVHVGAQLFEEGILGTLIRDKRTVILVTHQIQYLEAAHKVVVMKEGVVTHDGTYRSITESDSELAELWQRRKEEIMNLSESEEDEEGPRLDQERKELKKQISVGMESSYKEDTISIKDDESDHRGQLIEMEERERGSVPWTVYWYYLKAFNVILLVISLSFMVFQYITIVGSNFWLSAWADSGTEWVDFNATDPARDQLSAYAPIYSILSLSSVVLGAVGVLMTIYCSLLAAKKIHNKMLSAIVLAPLRFFDTTPVGRILNRFSSDVQVLDVNLGDNMDGFFRVSMICISSLIVNVIVTYYFVIVLVPVVIMYFLIWFFAIPTCRELKRIESITRSPVFAHFSESLGGLATIRAYRAQDRFMGISLEKIEGSNISYIYLQTSNRWLGVRLDLLGSITVLGSGMACVAAASFTGLSPSLLGLALTYVIYMAAVLSFVFQISTDMELQMNSVERLSHYTKVLPETYKGMVSAPPSWPSHGNIEFRDVSARYAVHLDPVLRNLNIDIKAGEKVGICGRTGSGKSSLVLTLFRVIDVFEGSIFIDDQNISMLPLTDLRRSLAIIPQDPILFTGSIRFNLDPFQQKDDDEIWEAIGIAQLTKTVQDLESGLDSLVTEGGENFSLGQRQLFCLARAFLRKSRILIMDEATASIDIQTDNILQEVVATAFQDRTVLTIAHRVSTILDADKIITLDNGMIVEYGDPQTLMATEGSIFASLVSANK